MSKQVATQWPKQVSPQYPEPRLQELCRASLHDVINHSTGSEREAAQAELASRPQPSA